MLTHVCGEQCLTALEAACKRASLQTCQRKRANANVPACRRSEQVLPRRPRHRAPAQHMHMQVVNRLAAIRARVEHRAIAACLQTGFACDARGQQHDIAYHRRIGRVRQRLHVLFGQYQCVKGCLR